jgi:hypothetical protein
MHTAWCIPEKPAAHAGFRPTSTRFSTARWKTAHEFLLSTMARLRLRGQISPENRLFAFSTLDRPAGCGTRKYAPNVVHARETRCRCGFSRSIHMVFHCEVENMGGTR